MTTTRQSLDAPAPVRAMPVHAIRTGTLSGNETFLRGSGWGSLLRRRRPVDFPVLAFVLEHPEGLIAIDTGMSAGARRPFSQRRFVPRPAIRPEDELGPQLRARGLRPEDVRRVVLTHLDWDHAGGLGHVPGAEVLVHRPELAASRTVMGRLRYQPQRWPAAFRPVPYDLDDGPYGPFPASRVLTDAGDVRAVPLPGHSAGQVGVVVECRGGRILFAGDHVLRQDWFVEDLAAGRLLGLGQFFPEQAAETSRRVHRLALETPTVLVPAHDAEAPRRLAAMEPMPT